MRKKNNFLLVLSTMFLMLSACGVVGGGSSIAYENNQPAISTVNIGSNSGLFFFPTGCADGACPTVSIPAGTGFPLSRWYTVEVSRTLSSFADITTPSFTRRGNAPTDDICTNSIIVHGFIVEYPRG